MTISSSAYLEEGDILLPKPDSSAIHYWTWGIVVDACSAAPRTATIMFRNHSASIHEIRYDDNAPTVIWWEQYWTVIRQ